MEPRLIKELDFNFVNVGIAERQQKIAAKLKECLSQLYKGMEFQLQGLMVRENLTKEQLIESYTVVEWYENEGLNSYFGMRVVKNEELERCLAQIQTPHYKTLPPFTEVY